MINTVVTHKSVYLLAAWLWLMLLIASPAPADDFRPGSLILKDGTSIPLRIYPASGDTLLLWLACDVGSGTSEEKVAQELAAGGLEVWLPDYLGGHFLPQSSSSVEQISGEEVAALIELARNTTGKRITLISSGRGALPVLRGAHKWQMGHPGDPALAGGILLYPELYAVTPAPGVEARYHEVVAQTSLPLFIYHAQRSPGRWWLEHLKVELKKGGSRVDSVVLPGIRGYFYTRPDATPEEEAMAGRLPELLRDGLKNLQGGRP